MAACALTMLTLFIFAAGGALPLQAQTEAAPAVVHNTWTSGTAMPTPVVWAASAVLKGEIYVVGELNSGGTIIADTQIYNPTTNSWSTGASLPTAVAGASAAVVKNVLYVFGGTPDEQTASNAVWAYNPKTKSWSSESAMLTARWLTAAVVDKIIYVMGGWANGDFLATVESYNPATDTWTEEAPMLGNKQSPAAALLKTTIVAADGATGYAVITGDTEGYDAATNAWTELTADPTARVGTCFGPVGAKLYDVGGFLNNGGGGAEATMNECSPCPPTNGKRRSHPSRKASCGPLLPFIKGSSIASVAGPTLRGPQSTTCRFISRNSRNCGCPIPALFFR